MHKPPAVDYPVGRSRVQSWALASLWSGVFIVDVGWYLQADGVSWRHWLAMAIALAAAAVALQAWRASPIGTLHWDGQYWWWESGRSRTGGVVKPHFDLQALVLLVFCTHSGARYWLWLERGSQPSRWNALRRAVYAPDQAGTDIGMADGARAEEKSRDGDMARP